MKRMVVGFAFTPEQTHVVLIRKTHPAWQAGKLNGVGGKLEPGETPLAAMVREFAEETGCQTTAAQWHHYVIFHSHQGAEPWELYVLCAFDIPKNQLRSITDEPLELHSPFSPILRNEGIGNVAWLVAAALEPDLPRLRMTATYDFVAAQEAVRG